MTIITLQLFMGSLFFLDNWKFTLFYNWRRNIIAFRGLSAKSFCPRKDQVQIPLLPDRQSTCCR